MNHFATRNCTVSQSVSHCVQIGLGLLMEEELGSDNTVACTNVGLKCAEEGNDAASKHVNGRLA